MTAAVMKRVRYVSQRRTLEVRLAGSRRTSLPVSAERYTKTGKATTSEETAQRMDSRILAGPGV
jgi:hypothetical protein